MKKMGYRMPVFEELFSEQETAIQSQDFVDSITTWKSL